MRRILLFLLFSLATGIYVSCRDKRTAHPKEEHFPYPSSEVIKAKGHFESVSEYTNKGELYPIDIYLEKRKDLKVKYLEEGKYLVLDTNNYVLYLYNSNKKSSRVINAESQGPKDLSWATDISVNGDSVYISTLDFRYIVYYCDVKCKHERTKRIPYQARSISATRKGVFLTTQQPLREKRKRTENMDGIIYNSSLGGNTFGRGYQHDGWLVKDKVNKSLMEAGGTEKVVAFKYIPYIFVYDEKSIEYKAKIESFKLPKFLYDDERGALSVNKNEEWSVITSIKEINESEYFISVRNMRNISEPVVESLRTYYLNTNKKLFVRRKEYKTDKSLKFEPIITESRTLYYQSGRIYD